MALKCESTSDRCRSLVWTVPSINLVAILSSLTFKRLVRGQEYLKTNNICRGNLSNDITRLELNHTFYRPAWCNLFSSIPSTSPVKLFPDGSKDGLTESDHPQWGLEPWTNITDSSYTIIPFHVIFKINPVTSKRLTLVHLWYNVLS